MGSLEFMKMAYDSHTLFYLFLAYSNNIHSFESMSKLNNTLAV